MAEKNIMYKLGWTEFTDDEYRNEFNIPGNVDVNEFMFDYSEKQNINYYMTELGMSDKEATMKAKARTKEAKAQLAKAMSK